MPVTASPCPRRGREPVSLRRLFPSASFIDCGDVRVTEAVEVAAEVGPGMLFAARRGASGDGVDHIGEAVARGATAVLVSRPVASAPVPQCVVPEVSRAFGQLTATLAGRPMRTVRTVGVTGTNGKTTVTWLVRALLRSAGRPCGLLGTVEYCDGETAVPATLTTPDARTFWDRMAAMAAIGTGHAAVELSSHALHQDRVAGAELEAAVVTNVTRDHLDYHGTPDAYLAAKAKIVSLVRPGGVMIVNQDDPAADHLAAAVPAELDLLTFGLHRRAAVQADRVEQSADGLRFDLRLRGRRVAVLSPLVGLHNVANCLAAAAVVHHFGLSAEEIAVGLRSAAAPPGRMQRIGTGPVTVFVDYAHTPDALTQAVAAARAVTAGRVIVVCGAGGDRDAGKREPLGAAAATADLVVLTSDNPRSEHPATIIAAMQAGAETGPGACHVESDRAAAIRYAIEAARPGDVVLIAGKGHETTQVLANRTIAFDDRTEAAAALKSRFGKPPLRRAA